jgi:hypothetical protein
MNPHGTGLLKIQIVDNFKHTAVKATW